MTRVDSRGICRDTEGGGGKKKKSKQERKTKPYHSVDILFPDFGAVLYLRVDICGVSKLTGMPVGFFTVYLSGLNLTTLGM